MFIHLLTYSMLRQVCFLFFCLAVLTGHSQLIQTIAGAPGQWGYSGDGSPAVGARYNKPFAIAIDNTGNLYIGDWYNRVIRKINPAGISSTYAGTGQPGYSGDGGPASQATMDTPFDIAVADNGLVYFVDLGNEVVRYVDQQGIIRTVAGTGSWGTGAPFIGDGGPAVAAPLFDVQAVAVDQAGTIYIAETAKNSIRVVNPQGIIRTLCGQGFLSPGYTGDGGPASQATLNAPADLAVDAAGNLYIADIGNHVIRMINPAGIISTVAGMGAAGYSGDGGPARSALLNRPFGICLGPDGALYIAEEGNFVVRKISPAGVISTIAGTGTEGYSGDGGPALFARLSSLHRVVVDAAGFVYLTDDAHHTVRKIGGCASTLPTAVNIVASPPTGCAGDTLRFVASPVNGGTTPHYQWTINGVAAGENDPVFRTAVLADGDLIGCVMTSSEPCTAPAEATPIQVRLFPLPVVRLPAEIIIQPGGSIPLAPDITGNPVSFAWSPVIGLDDPLARAPLASPGTSTTYQVEVTDPNGCKGMASTRVVVYQRLFLPSGFSPNGDGLNDVFRLPPGATFDLTLFSVFDRWGNLVFRTRTPDRGWDGTCQGAALPAGVFTYVVLGKDNQQPVVVKGTVVLVR